MKDSGIKGCRSFQTGYPLCETGRSCINPQIILLAQGKKNVYLGDKRYVYDPEHYYVQTVPLPVQCEAVIQNNKPMLGMVISIDPQIIGEIIFEMETEPPRRRTGDHKSVYDASVSAPILDAVIRSAEDNGFQERKTHPGAPSI